MVRTIYSYNSNISNIKSFARSCQKKIDYRNRLSGRVFSLPDENFLKFHTNFSLWILKKLEKKLKTGGKSNIEITCKNLTKYDYTLFIYCILAQYWALPPVFSFFSSFFIIHRLKLVWDIEKTTSGNENTLPDNRSR